MTSEERSRAKKLGRLSQAYSKSIPHKGLIAAAITIMALTYPILFFAGIREYILAAHIFLSNFILFMCSNDNVGDGGAPNGSDIGLPITGSSGTGAFFCTLPFEAKDILRMRFRTLEINFAVTAVPAVIIQTVLILTGSSEGLFPSGFCAAALSLAELLYTVTIFIRKYQVKLYANISVFVLSAFVSVLTFVTDEDIYPIIKAFEFLSGWIGVAVLVISPIIISAVGEIYLKNKKDPSWHLR